MCWSLAIFAKGKKGARGAIWVQVLVCFEKHYFAAILRLFSSEEPFGPLFLCNLKKKLKRLNVEITKSTYYPASAIFLCRNSGHMQFEKKRKVFNCFFGGRKKSSTDIQSPIFFSFVSRYTFSSNHNIHKSFCGLCFWASDP